MPKEVKKLKRRNKLRAQIIEVFGSYSVAEHNTGIDTTTISRLVTGERDPTEYQIEVFGEFGIDKFE